MYEILILLCRYCDRPLSEKQSDFCSAKCRQDCEFEERHSPDLEGGAGMSPAELSHEIAVEGRRTKRRNENA